MYKYIYKYTKSVIIYIYTNVEFYVPRLHHPFSSNASGQDVVWGKWQSSGLLKSNFLAALSSDLRQIIETCWFEMFNFLNFHKSYTVVLCCSANFYICLPSSMNSSIWLAIQLFRHVCAHLWPKCELLAVDTRVSDADLDKADLTGCIKTFANWYATSTFAKSRSGKEESWKMYEHVLYR